MHDQCICFHKFVYTYRFYLEISVWEKLMSVWGNTEYSVGLCKQLPVGGYERGLFQKVETNAPNIIQGRIQQRKSGEGGG